MSEPTHSGGCACGAVRYRVTGPLRPVVGCHCRECRRISGHYMAATQARRADVVINGTAAIQWYTSSPGVQRGFCRTCGSHLFFAREGGERLSILAGSLDRAADLPFIGEIHAAEKGDYYPLNPARAQLDRGSAEELLTRLGYTPGPPWNRTGAR